MSAQQPPESSKTLSLVEETLHVGRRTVPTGRVEVRTVTERNEVVVGVPLATCEVEIVRVPVGREVDTMPEVRTEGDVTIIPVVEEVPVVVTRLLLREEIHVKRRTGVRHLELPVQLLKQRAIVTREGREQSHDGRETMTDASTIRGTGHGRTLTAFFDNRADAEEAMVRIKTLVPAGTDVRLTGGEDYSGRADTDRGFWESISDFFFPPEDRATYAEGLRRGGFIVTAANVPEGQYEAVLDILDDEGSIDLDERADVWRAEGWRSDTVVSDPALGANPVAAPMTGADVPADRTTMTAGAVGDAGHAAPLGDETRHAYGIVPPGSEDRALADATTGRLLGDEDTEVIPVIREDLRVGKRDVNLGRVRVRSYVIEEPVSEEVSMHEERVEIERRPVDRALGVDEAAFTDRSIEAEEHAEEAVISKEARVVEEIVLRRHASDHTETVSDTIRRTEVEVEDDRMSATERHATPHS